MRTLDYIPFTRATEIKEHVEAFGGLTIKSDTAETITADSFSGDKSVYIIGIGSAVKEYYKVSNKEPALASAIYNIQETQGDYIQHIGFWKNPKTGLVEVEPVLITRDLEIALRIAINNEQIAIYNMKTDETIYIERLKRIFKRQLKTEGETK